MDYSYKAPPYKTLREIIKKEIIPYHDGIIEAGIGNNLERYNYFRDKGYKGIYIGVDIDKRMPELGHPPAPVIIPSRLNYEVGDCFDTAFLQALLREYDVKNPIFVTNSALCDCLLTEHYDNHMEDAVEALTLFKKQLHIKPAGNFPITPSRVYPPENIDNQEYKKFMKFLEESRKRGWKESIGRNIVLLKHEHSE